MSIELTENEKNLREEIRGQLDTVYKMLKKYRIDNEVQDLIEKMGKNAHELHMSLKNNGNEPHHHEYMLENREVEPEDPQFYMHVHPVEDLLKFIDDPHANDDPKDQTIGQDFEFRVYSRRWGHEDIYLFKRTAEGWDIQFLLKSGPCDKGGNPFLFDNLNHDLIQYPRGLDGWLEWLWEQAASKGLSKGEVQTALNELADWVCCTETNAPSGDVWKGYSSCENKKMNLKTGVVTFLDVIGWKGIYTRKTDAIATFKGFIKEIHSQAQKQRGRIKYNENVVEVRNVSDTIVLITPCLEEDASKALDVHGKLCKWIIPYSINLEIPVRGATTFGEFELDPKENIFVGKAIDEAAAWHEMADWIGVNLTPSAEYVFVDKDDDTCWVPYNPPIKTVQKVRLHCVYWSKDWTDKQNKLSGIKNKFCRLGPIVPEFAGKFENTLKFIQTEPKSSPEKT